MQTTRRTFLAALAAASSGLGAGEVFSALSPEGADMANVPNPLDEMDPKSGLGSLSGPIQRIRDAYGWASNSFASDKYKPADHAEWRKQALADVFASMQYAPAKTDFAAETVEKVDCGDYVREKIYFNTTPELRVPAYVLVPKGLKGKAPAIVALHDHGGFYRFGKEKLVSLPDEHPALTEFKGCYAGKSIADELVLQGYVVIVIDMFFWGERRVRLPNDKTTGETVEDVRKFNASRQQLEQLMARTIFASGFTWAGVIFWDDIRTVDYLVSRPEVDASRIGCVGLSLGSWRAAHLTALDERIKAGVAVCWLSTVKAIPPSHYPNTIGFTKLLPGLYRRLDMPDVVSLAAPRALLCINGTKDGLFPIETGVKPAYRTLEQAYAKASAADRFKGSIYDAPHEFNLDMQKEAWKWLKKWL
jgi:dienelactone hydrolase